MDTGANWFAPGGRTHSLIGSRGTNGTHDHMIIESGGTSTEFGDLTSNRGSQPACYHSETRGITHAGYLGGNLNTIDYFTFETAGNAAAFGSSTTARHGATGMQNTVRGVGAGGHNGGHLSVMDYVTMATTGSATTFGSMTISAHLRGSVSNNTRGVMYRGDNGAGTHHNNIDYITIATTGSATDFGDTINRGWGYQGASDATKGLLMPYYVSGNVGYITQIETITIGTTGDATNFGDMTDTGRLSSVDNAIIAVGVRYSTSTTSLEQITIQTNANATSFGGTLREGKNGHVHDSCIAKD